jgi:hypothetical protein
MLAVTLVRIWRNDKMMLADNWDYEVASEASIERAKARELPNGGSLWGGC